MSIDGGPAKHETRIINSDTGTCECLEPFWYRLRDSHTHNISDKSNTLVRIEDEKIVHYQCILTKNQTDLRDAKIKLLLSME